MSVKSRILQFQTQSSGAHALTSPGASFLTASSTTTTTTTTGTSQTQNHNNYNNKEAVEIHSIRSLSRHSFESESLAKSSSVKLNNGTSISNPTSYNNKAGRASPNSHSQSYSVTGGTGTVGVGRAGELLNGREFLRNKSPSFTLPSSPSAGLTLSTNNTTNNKVPHLQHQSQTTGARGGTIDREKQTTTTTTTDSTTATMSTKKTSLSINLNGNVNGGVGNGIVGVGGLTSPTKALAGLQQQSVTSGSSSNGSKPRTPTKTFSSIPKPKSVVTSPVSNVSGYNHSSSSFSTGSGGVTTRGAVNGTGFGYQNQNGGGGSGDIIDWKDKYEESEKKRTRVVALAQKATRDYEELRRRYQDSCLEREKMSNKLSNANCQLEALRKASEAAYDEYYKLKKKYDNENNAKSEALSRVDQYNKENRRLKRQSALMMQQMNDPNFAIEEEAEVVDGADNDKEISYLRKRIQELEGKIVELESELEKLRLDEFETQESVILMNDAMYSSKSETTRMRDQLRKLEGENRKLHDSLDDALVEIENIKGKDVLERDRLRTAQTELQKMRTEKNILARQSLVFMNEATSDNRILDALGQISDLQTALEEQKSQLNDEICKLRKRLNEKEAQEETFKIQNEANIKALEEEVKIFREKAEEAERKLEDFPVVETFQPPPPPPPPPPMGGFGPPPPPPMMHNSLTNSLSSQLKTLRKVNEGSPQPDDGSAGTKSQISANPQIDDMITQLKKGIKLRPMEKSMSRKPTTVPVEKPPESHAVEEMRSILNNLKRTRRC